MNKQEQQSETLTPADVETVAAAAIAKELALSNLEKAYFQPANLEKANDAIRKVMEICKANKVEPKWNFDAKADIEPGFGIAIIPTNIRDENLNKNITIGCWIAVIPTVAAVREDEKGAAFLDQSAQDKLITYFSNAVRPKKDKETGQYMANPNSVPESVDDYISAGRRESALKFFNEVADKYIKLLKKSGFTNLKKDMFRQVLSSASFAKQIYAGVPQEQWEGLLKVMVSEAENNPEYDAGMVLDWLKNRNETTISLTREDAAIDLEALTKLANPTSVPEATEDSAPATA